jgi:hypothetical protein
LESISARGAGGTPACVADILSARVEGVSPSFVVSSFPFSSSAAEAETEEEGKPEEATEGETPSARFEIVT